MGESPKTSLVNQNGQSALRQASCPSCGAVVEYTDRQEPLYLAIGEAGHSARVLVRVRSYRRKLLDRDNLFPKYFIDACRYSGLIRDDTARLVLIDCDQEKVETEEEERTEIELLYPSAESLVNHNPPPLFA